MSAAEKLRALGAAWRSGEYTSDTLMPTTVMDALPQIVSVVELAEENDARWQAAHMNSDFTSALAALDKALGEDVT